MVYIRKGYLRKKKTRNTHGESQDWFLVRPHGADLKTYLGKIVTKDIFLDKKYIGKRVRVKVKIEEVKDE